MNDERNWNWAWATVGTAIRKHGASLTPEQIAALIEQGIEHGINLSIAVFEFEELNRADDCTMITRSSAGIAQRLRHEFYGEDEWDFSRYTK